MAFMGTAALVELLDCTLAPAKDALRHGVERTTKAIFASEGLGWGG